MRYHVQSMGTVTELSEEQLVAQLRGSFLSGRELARPEDEDEWRPLYELPVFREAVPHVGDPRDLVRRRVVSGFAWHLLAYGVVAGALLGVSSLPALVWGIFVAIHAMRALPVAWQLGREGKLLGAGHSSAALPGPRNPASLTAPAAAGLAAPAAAGLAAPDATALPPASELDALVEEVRSMLVRHASEGDDAASRLDGVARSLRELRSRIARLSTLLAAEDREALEARLVEAQQALDGAEPDDQALRRREVEVLRESLATDDRARRALERLELRERLGLQQLRQLRLDLARLEADAPGPEDLDERLEQIRLETEATAEADALVGRA